jgi:hypothetical protein
MRTDSASIDIDAPIEKVWAIVASTQSYPSFDPSCAFVKGMPQLGTRILYASTTFSERGQVFRVTGFSPPRRMVWSATSMFGLALRRTRTFALEPLERVHTRFTLKEELSGFALSLSRRSLPDLSDAFAGFCRGLKEIAEA